MDAELSTNEVAPKLPVYEPKGTGAITVGIAHLSEDVVLGALVQAMEKVPLWIRENLKFKVLDHPELADSHGQIVTKAIPRAVIFEELPSALQIVEGMADLFSYLCGPGPKEGGEGTVYLMGIYHAMQMNHSKNVAGKEYWTMVVSLTDPLVVKPEAEATPDVEAATIPGTP